jgi:hypothetical protein
MQAVQYYWLAFGDWMMQPLWGGNVAGIIIGMTFTALGVYIFAWVCWRDFFKKDELSDEEFMDIALTEMNGQEFRDALDKDDEYA